MKTSEEIWQLAPVFGELRSEQVQGQIRDGFNLLTAQWGSDA